MGGLICFGLFLLTANPTQIICDSNNDCFYLSPQVIAANKRVPGLILLHCNGATAADLDSCREIGDSVGWVLATCHSSKNHRDIYLNDADIVRTIEKMRRIYPVDPSRIYLFGYSGQGVQALATMLMHPELVRGVIAVCGHHGALPLAVPEQLKKHFVYLVSREQDWNLMANYQMYWQFNSWGAVCTLTVKPGEHSPGSWHEILSGCYWLNRQKISK
jgi:predicted esterase